jgi:mono/diheme cytochrome c family protein
LGLLVHIAAAALGAMSWLCVAPPSPGGAQPAAKIASSNPLSGVPAAVAAGERLYAKFCLQCHGANGDGVSPRWGRMGADLRKYWRGYTEFVNIVAAGRPEKRMPPWGSVLDADQINQVGAYLETLALPGAKWTD